jgi:hypothetical protein
MTVHAHVLPIYQRFRQVNLRVNHKLVETLSKDVLNEGARRLGILQRDVIVFGSEDEAPVLMDYCICNVYRNGMNAVQHYLTASPPRAGSDEMILLQAMQQAYYSLFRVNAQEPGVGVAIQDALRGDSAFLADIGFSHSMPKGQIFASRLIPLEDFVMTGGAGLPVNQSAMSRIVKELEHSFGSTTDLGHLSDTQEADLAAMVIRTLLRSGASEQIQYQTPGEAASQSERLGGGREFVRANRNDPCPCGSGRKYKSCCGKS